MPYKDHDKAKECTRNAMRRWIDRNPEEHKKRSREAARKFRENNPERSKEINKKCVDQYRAWWNDYKASLKCCRCGEDHVACLDFHHIDPGKKDLNISRITKSGGSSRKRLLEEIGKCIVLCANCHRKEHHENVLASKVKKSKILPLFGGQQ